MAEEKKYTLMTLETLFLGTQVKLLMKYIETGERKYMSAKTIGDTALMIANPFYNLR